MVDMVDGVLPQRKYLRQPAADLVDEEHDAEGLVTVKPCLARRRQRHGVKVVVAKLAGRPPLRGVVAEVRAVGIPLAHRRGVGRHPLLDRNRTPAPEADRPPAADRRGRRERFPAQHRRGIRLPGQRRDAAPDAVDLKPLEELKRASSEWQRMTEELDRVFGQPPGLVGVGGKEPGGVGS